MKTLYKILSVALLSLPINQALAADSPGVEHNTQAFLNALHGGGGKPMEQMTPQEALRDEGEAYALKLVAAGVPVTAVRCNGMIHDFGLLNVISQIPATRSAILQASEALKRHLQ